jgi:hypothetical protein
MYKEDIIFVLLLCAVEYPVIDRNTTAHYLEVLFENYDDLDSYKEFFDNKKLLKEIKSLKSKIVFFKTNFSWFNLGENETLKEINVQSIFILNELKVKIIDPMDYLESYSDFED